MSPEQPQSVTTLLEATRGQAPGAFARLVEATYTDMYALASGKLGPRPDTRLAAEGVGATALADETFERLMAQRNLAQNREQFFALATRLMRRVLVDHRRRVCAQRRGGDRRREGLTGLPAVSGDPEPSRGREASELVRSGILQLHRLDPRKAEVVTLHAVCGIPIERVAEMVGVSRATVERDWSFGRAWLAAFVARERPE